MAIWRSSGGAVSSTIVPSADRAVVAIDTAGPVANLNPTQWEVVVIEGVTYYRPLFSVVA